MRARSSFAEYSQGHRCFCELARQAIQRYFSQYNMENAVRYMENLLAIAAKLLKELHDRKLIEGRSSGTTLEVNVGVI